MALTPHRVGLNGGTGGLEFYNVAAAVKGEQLLETDGS